MPKKGSKKGSKKGQKKAATPVAATPAPAAAAAAPKVETLCPNITWAETSDAVFVTISVMDSKDHKISVTEDAVDFFCENPTGGKPYGCTLKLKGKVDTESKETLFRATAREVTFHLVKKGDDTERWNRLCEDKTLYKNFIKCDYDKWVDSDDEEADAGFDTQGMGGMPPGGMGGMGGMGGGGMPGMPGMGGMGGMGGGGMPGMPGMGGGAGGPDMAKMMEMMQGMGGGAGGAGGAGGMDMASMMAGMGGGMGGMPGMGGDMGDEDDEDDDLPDLEDADDAPAK